MSIKGFVQVGTRRSESKTLAYLVERTAEYVKYILDMHSGQQARSRPDRKTKASISRGGNEPRSHATAAEAAPIPKQQFAL